MTRLALLLLALSGAVGCAAGPIQREDDLRTLTRECRERGGVLVPLPGQVSSNQRANYACQIHGGASRIQ